MSIKPPFGRRQLSGTCRLRVRGIVQGVGFRPHVWRLATALGLAGWVRNDADGVTIIVRGMAAKIDAFIARLAVEAPPLARIDGIERTAGEDEPGDDAPAAVFRILDSTRGAVRTAIGPDAAMCADCRAEILDPANRRYRYAFTTCTHCGPRYTIARGLPYDREKTSLAPFPLCEACGREYCDPADRRFHAEATCCPDCGPQLRLSDSDGGLIAGDPIAETLRLLDAGGIVAIKGLGGFHLACDARNVDAVARLRLCKGREAKPFAVMATSPAVIAPYAAVSAEEQTLLASPAAPVVLLEQTALCAAALPGIAPGLNALGFMLPNTPLQWLLFHQAAGRPAGTGWIERTPPELLLVMTSANPQGEPLVIDDAEALSRLAGIADAVLGHNRVIVARADDSVIRCDEFSSGCSESSSSSGEASIRGGESRIPSGDASARRSVFIRRGRGYTPQAIKLPASGPSVLAFGGWFKNTICVTRGDQAFVSTHIGDLDNAAACAFLDETVERLLALSEIEPEIVAHDAHPDFYSTQAAHRFAARHGLPARAVQHHHAHLAAVAAEHRISGPALGLALDGVGLGDDGTAWGGELLRVDGAGFERLGHLAPLALPGGDRAAREPWRMGAAALWAIGRGDTIDSRFAAHAGAATVRQMLERGLNCPATSSAGRLFDAAAGLLGVQPLAQYEAQAAMRLEALAEQYGDCAALAGGWTIRDGVLDLSPLLAALADETDAARGAALFHRTFAAALADWVLKVALPENNCDRRESRWDGRPTSLSGTVLAAGGCCLNRTLMLQLSALAARRGIGILSARQLPPGDGGLSLGQAWVAMQTSG